MAGCFAVVIPDNMSPIVDKANPLEPRLNQAFVEYAQDRGFLIDATRVRHPQDKPRVERDRHLRAPLVLRRRELRGQSRRPAPGRAVVHDDGGTAGARHHGVSTGRALQAIEAQALAPGTGVPL